MSPEEALSMLSLTADPNGEVGADAAAEALEDALFEENQFFMRRAFIPALVSVRCRKIERLDAAAEALGHHWEGADKEALRDLYPSSEAGEESWAWQQSQAATSIYSGYQQWEGRVKRRLSTALSAAASTALYRLWELGFCAYAERFCKVVEAEHSGISPDASVKMSGLSDPTALLEALRAGSNGPVAKELLEYYSRLKKISDRC